MAMGWTCKVYPEEMVEKDDNLEMTDASIISGIAKMLLLTLNSS